MQLKFTLLLTFALGCLHGIVAQETVSRQNDQTITADRNASNLAAANKGWQVYMDEENQVYYIDFETLRVNLSDIVVKDASGKVILKDDVFDLPVNTIYELDLNQFSTGKYDLELHSFTGVVQKASFTRP